METHQLTFKDRALGAVWGQFAGDAAALGAHWIYDLEELGRRYPVINGFEKPAHDHYHFGKIPGDQTHYGDAALLLLESLADCGRFEIADFAHRFVWLFGSPSYHGYRDHATRETLLHLEAQPENFANGADDDQPATVTRLASLVVRYQGAPDLLAHVAALTQFSQRNAVALAYARGAAQLLEALLHGLAPKEALQAVSDTDVQTKIRAVRDFPGTTVREATLFFGQKCPMPNSFPAALDAFLRYPQDFPASILETIRAGGDSAARASMIGMWSGALNGVQAIPREWIEKLRARERIERAVERLIPDPASS